MRTIKMVCCALSALLMFGCLHASPTVVVPVMKNAAEQYAYAKRYQTNQELQLISDEKKYEKTLNVIIKTYEEVGSNFPDDRQFTPLAKLDVIILKSGMDSPHFKPKGYKLNRRLNRAIDDLAEVAHLYPEHEFVQAMVMFQQAQCYRALMKYDQAQQRYKNVMDTYKGKPDTAFKQLVYLATIYYNQVYTK